MNRRADRRAIDPRIDADAKDDAEREGENAAPAASPTGARERRLRSDPAARPRSRSIAVFPTLCTLGNALCGFAAIFYAGRSGVATPGAWSPLTTASVLVFAGMIFDMLDGRLARLTNSSSDLGEQLDSMADMVTFGVAPAFMACQLVVGETVPFLSEDGDVLYNRVGLVIAGLYVACAALRLARFNVESLSAELKEHLAFHGLPTPGAAGTVVSMIVLHQHFLSHRPTDHWTTLAASFGLVAVLLICALMMVSRVRYVHVLNRYVKGRAPLSYVVMGVVVLGLLLVRPQISIAIAFTLYALSGPLGRVLRPLTRRIEAEVEPPV